MWIGIDNCNGHMDIYFRLPQIKWELIDKGGRFCLAATRWELIDKGGPFFLAPPKWELIDKGGPFFLAPGRFRLHLTHRCSVETTMSSILRQGTSFCVYTRDILSYRLSHWCSLVICPRGRALMSASKNTTCSGT